MDPIDRNAVLRLPRNVTKNLSGEVIEETIDVDRIKRLPSVQPERLTDDDFETIRIHLSAYKERLCNQRRWKEAEEYQRIINRFMSFASAQPEIIHCGECKHMCPRFRRVIRRTVQEIEEERKKGVWIEHLDCGYIECPFCGSATTCDNQEAEMDLHYCFNCGANLRAKIGERDD